MILTFNGNDLSQLITRYGYTETPRRVTGTNEAVALNGDIIDDTVAVKYDPSFLMRPLTVEQVATLWQLASLLGMRPLSYTSADGTVKNTSARLIVEAGANKVMETEERTLYDGITIRFEVK